MLFIFKYKFITISIKFKILLSYSSDAYILSPDGFHPPTNSLTSVFLLRFTTVKFYPIAFAIKPNVYVLPIPVFAINKGFSLFYKDIITFSIKLLV